MLSFVSVGRGIISTLPFHLTSFSSWSLGFFPRRSPAKGTLLVVLSAKGTISAAHLRMNTATLLACERTLRGEDAPRGNMGRGRRYAVEEYTLAKKIRWRRRYVVKGEHASGENTLFRKNTLPGKTRCQENYVAKRRYTARGKASSVPIASHLPD